MSNLPRGPADLDGRLARLIGTLDAAPGFEARLAARIARERPLADPLTRDRARERLQRERHAAERALRRKLRTNLLLVAGAAGAAIGPALICGRILAGALSTLSGDGGLALAGASGAIFIAWTASVVARAARGQPATALLA
jgi:hypothetical protein